MGGLICSAHIDIEVSKWLAEEHIKGNKNGNALHDRVVPIFTKIHGSNCEHEYYVYPVVLPWNQGWASSQSSFLSPVGSFA